VTVAHRVILASAGTGKTFQLSHRYIGLLAEGASPEQILATTFTRKAAGEILERILLRLAAAAANEDTARELGEIIGRGDVTSSQCLDWLSLLVGRLDRLQVRTLDSFFVHLATLFGHDLGLPPGWSLADESDLVRIRDEAVAGMTAAMEPSEAAALIRDLKQSGEGLTRSTHEVLRDRVVSDAFALHRVARPGAWERYSAPPAVDENVLVRAMEELEVVELPTTKAGRPSKRWESARDSVLNGARSGDWKTVVGKGLGKALLVNGGLFYNEKIPEDVAGMLRPMLSQAAHELLGSLVSLNRSYGTLLDRYATAEAVAKLALRRQGFDDIPAALCGGPAVSSEAMSHRLDGRVEHLLLDEFQDTSVQQWAVLAPLAQRLVEPGPGHRSFFCVGDVKQSIYGWRGGESRLLSDLSERLGLGQPDTMVLSRRSSPVVLDTVNRVFSKVSLSPVFKNEPAREAAAERWQAGFEEHQAHTPFPGHAALFAVASLGATVGEQSDDVVAAAAEHVRGMTSRGPWLTVGVLVRRKAIATKLIAKLRGLGVEASGEGGTPLTDSAAVRLALSVLQLADHPGDSAAGFHVAHSPLAEALDLTVGSDARARRRLSLRVRRALLSRGYGAWLSELAALIARCPEFNDRDRRRFAQLVDLGLTAGPRAGLRPADFCRQVRVTSVEDTAAANVRVMTVHASKGLEFDAVVLADLDGELARPPKLLVGQPDPWQGPASLLAGVSKELLPLDENLELLSGETWGRSVEEALCVLYVALTRAARSVDLFVARPAPTAKKGGTIKRTFGTLLRAALRQPDADVAADSAEDVALEADSENAGGGVSGHADLQPQWLHPDSADDWWLHVPGAAAAAAQPGDELGATETTEHVAPKPRSRSAGGSVVLQPSLRPRFLSRRAPSSAEGGGVVRPRDLLANDSDFAKTRGSAVHLWFEQIEWLDDFSMTDGKLLSLARQRLGDHALFEVWLAEWRGWLAGDVTVGLLTRPSDEPEVWRERSFLLPVKSGSGQQLLGGAFDRVHLHRDSEGVTAATVIDFKSDGIGDEAQLAKKRHHYGPQLAEYRTAVAQLTGLDESAVRCVLLFVAANRQVDV
jgi:ATP-dependent helicase/nuclease subunit A